MALVEGRNRKQTYGNGVFHKLTQNKNKMIKKLNSQECIFLLLKNVGVLSFWLKKKKQYENIIIDLV